MCVHIEIPKRVDYILKELQKHGYEGYAVGGCVRDAILGREPEDWDITTSATPEQVKQIFPRTIDTGIQHGTVTVMINKEGFEVTTYRIDGNYVDGRHPENVEFTSDLIEDLKRRDFTINAMAYNKEQGLVDAFDGKGDLERGVIRCVGAPRERFSEDALRMLRAVRFAGQLGFEIDQETKKAIMDLAPTLEKISAERIRVELDKLLCSKKPEHLLTANELGITKVVLPEFDIMLKTSQNHPHHQYNVGIHCLQALKNVHNYKKGMDKRIFSILCWTALLHDVGKPDTKTVDEEGIEHFYNHAQKSRELTKKILKRLRWDNYTIDTVCHLVQYHDVTFSLKENKMRKKMSEIGVEYMPYVFLIKEADILAQSDYMRIEKLENLKAGKQLFEQIKNSGDCVTLKQLAVNGKLLQEHGFEKGKLLGVILHDLLEYVMENPKENQEDILLDYAKKKYQL